MISNHHKVNNPIRQFKPLSGFTKLIELIWSELKKCLTSKNYKHLVT